MSVMAASWVEETMPYQEAEGQREGHWKLWPGEECFWKEVGAGRSGKGLEDGGWVWAVEAFGDPGEVPGLAEG